MYPETGADERLAMAQVRPHVRAHIREHTHAHSFPSHTAPHPTHPGIPYHTGLLNHALINQSKTTHMLCFLFQK